MSTNPTPFDSTVRDASGAPLGFTDMTSLATAQANVLATSQAECAQRNDNLKSIYLTGFNNWKISVDAGRIGNTNPPKPPKAYVVKVSEDGWAYFEPGDQPVCDVPPIPADMTTPNPANVIDVGVAIGGKWWSCGPKDTFPIEKNPTPPVTSEDGVTGTFEKYAAPVGKGWYMKLS